jgi:hypothetical protein
LIINGLGASDETLRRHAEHDLRPDENYLVGAAARLRGRLFPAWMSFRGYFLVATDQALLLYSHHRLTSEPAGLVRRISLDGIRRGEITTREARTQVNADIPIVDGAVLRLAFIGADKVNGQRMIAAISG